MKRLSLAVFASLVLGLAAGADEPPFGADFPPTVAVLKATVDLGDVVAVGGPKAVNFLPDETFNVYIVPHRPWRDGDPLGETALATSQTRSDAKGTLLRTTVWKAVRPGRFDIVIDYDGDGRFSYALDAVDAVDIRGK